MSTIYIIHKCRRRHNFEIGKRN